MKVCGAGEFCIRKEGIAFENDFSKACTPVEMAFKKVGIAGEFSLTEISDFFEVRLLEGSLFKKECMREMCITAESCCKEVAAHMEAPGPEIHVGKNHGSEIRKVPCLTLEYGVDFLQKLQPQRSAILVTVRCVQQAAWPRVGSGRVNGASAR